MISRRAIVWLIAAVWMVFASTLWLSLWNPSTLPVVIAEPLQAEVEAEPDARAGDTREPARFTVHNATAEDLGRLDEAVTAFATADLELPGLDVWFRTDRRSCAGYHGLFMATSQPWQIQICSSDMEFVYEHELAHAWVTANVDERTRTDFMNLRGLGHWAGPDVPWNERGTEWAAVVIQQGLSGLPLPPALSDERTSRLVSYELLTGRVAPVLIEWIAERDVACPDRPTGLSRLIADAAGRSCAIGDCAGGRPPCTPDRNRTVVSVDGPGR